MPYASRLLPVSAAASAVVLAAVFAPLRTAAHPVSPLPGFVRPAEAPMDALPPPDQASTGAYWLLYDVQQDIPTRQAYEHHALKVLSEAGLSEASQITVDYEPSYEKVLWHRITLWRNGKAVELLPRLKATEMRREEEWDWGLLDGRLTQLFSLEDVRVGDVVEYSRTLVGENPIFGDKLSGTFWFRFTMPIDRLAYRLLHAPGRPVHLQGLNDAPDPDTARTRERTAYAWHLDRVPAQVEDDDAPSWNAAYPRMQWGEYASWSEVVDWALPLYRVEGPLSQELEKVVAKLRKAEPRERIRMALRLVQDDVRYLGLEMGSSSHRPRHPDKVFARRFGDCKDKSLLFCTLLRRAGMEADPVLVNSNGLRGVEDWRPSPLVFDHVIARARFEGRLYWFDPTLNHQRGDPLENQALDYGRGLAVVRGGGAFDTIQPGPGDGGRLDIHQAFDLPDIHKSATLEVTTTATGSEADRIRELFATSSREELAKTYLNYYARTYKAITRAAPMRLEDDTAGNVVVVRETYTVDSLCREADRRLACNLYPGEIAHWVSEPDRRIRTSPYGLDFPKDIRQVIRVDLPRAIDFKRDTRTVSHPDFRFSWDEKAEGHTATFLYDYQALNDHVPLERFPSFLAALDTLEGNMGAWIYPQGEGSGWSFDHPNHFMYLFALVCLGAGLRAARRLPFIPPARLVPAGFLALPIGGFATLIGLLVVASPFAALYDLWGCAYLFDMEAWLNLTQSDRSGYHPLWLPILLPVVGGGIALVPCEFALIRLFRTRHRSFPRAFALVLAVEWGLATWDAFAFRLLPESLGGTDFGAPEWAGMTVLTAGMLAYMSRSERMRNTFVFPLSEAPASEFAVREKAADGESAAP